MKPLLPLLAVAAVVVTGCATHYHRVEGDRLTLYLDEPRAGEVALACSLDDFTPRKARRVEGRWVVSLSAERPFRYYYVLDGKPYVPPCRLKENDDFGSANCIFDPQL